MIDEAQLKAVTCACMDGQSRNSQTKGVSQEGLRIGEHSERCQLIRFSARLFDVKCGSYLVFFFCIGLLKFQMCLRFVTALTC